MQIEQKFSLATPPATAWAAFHDVHLLVECLPGASIDGSKPENEVGVPLLFKVKLGPIAAGFAGRGRMLLEEAAQTGSFSGTAVDAKTNSRVKGEAGFSLAGDGTGTLVTVGVNFNISGALAQFSREGIVRALAETLTQQFAHNLQARLSQVAPQTLSGAPITTPAPGEVASAIPPDHSPLAAAPASSLPKPASRPPDTSTLDAWTLIKVWWRGLWAKGASRP